ncbi:BIRC7_8 [Mytilus edulis]|uniref:BIRC7_8 n=1 Tax=Mytilus edulis TaxID=6550 RepID=A0A8S3PTM5_MYTED|nr:BIRC7_8 [Mytilus edulis]
MLADAGFYYNHTDLECFQCRLRTNPEKWLPKETPKEAHARISPECAFVKLYSRSQRCDTPESPEQRSSCDCPINPNDNSYIKHSISEQNSHLTRQPEYVVVPHQNTNVMQTTALVKPLLSNDVNTSDRRGINLDNSNIQPTSDIKTATSTVCDSANNPSYTEHSIQPTIDAMNSQLTIDGFQSRIQAPAEPEYRYPQYNSYSSRYQSYGNWPFHTNKQLIVYQKPGIFTQIYNPKHAAFDDKESRIATFDDWRRDIEQTPEILADSGFFYTGDDDVVRCHYCDGGLRNWEPGDVPWEEHGRWFPFCKFVIKMKGREYIEEIRAKYEERQRLGNQPEISNNRSSDLPDPQKLKEINKQLKDKMKCIRCRTNDICMLFVNCGHRQTCEECADLMDFCPICDTRIKKRLKTFLS